MSSNDYSKIEFTFDFSKENFSELELEKNVYSRQYFVAHVAWKLHICKKVAEKSEEHVLGLHLFVDGETKLWCCYARVRLTILSQKEGIPNRSRTLERLFSSASKGWGYDSFIDWDTVTNTALGYIKNDIVKFQVHIVADPPQNVDPNYKKVTVAPVKSEDWLSVFEDRINEQIVNRVSEEFKKVVASVDEGNIELKNLKADIGSVQEEIKTVQEDVSSFEEDISTLKEDISTLKEDISNLKEDISTIKVHTSSKEDISALKEDISTIKDHTSSVNSAIVELKTLLLEKNENTDGGKAHGSCSEEENKNQKDGTDSRKTVALSEDFVVKKLNDFENKMMKEIFSRLQSWSVDNRLSYGVPPWYGYNESFPFTSCRRGCKAESGDHICNTFHSSHESVSGHQFGCTVQNKCARNELGCSTSSSMTHQLHEIEKYLDQSDTNESESTDTSHYVFVPPRATSNSGIPSEEEALSKNMDLNKPWRKKIVFIGKDGDGKEEIHIPTCLKQLFDLKKKFKEYEVYEGEKIQSA